MRIGDDKTFWQKVKAGRYKGEAAAMRRAMRGRAARIFSIGSRDRSPVVVKQVSIARPVAALQRIARYIGRLDVDYDELKSEKLRNINTQSKDDKVFIEDLGGKREPG
jgi:hypothetical protein